MTGNFAAYLDSRGLASADPEDAPEPGASNDPTNRRSYKAIEIARGGTVPKAGPWTFTLRWRETAEGTNRPLRREKAIPYFHIGEIDNTGAEHVSLITTYSLVHLEGENLTALIGELSRRRADAVQEFDPALWDEPPPGQPVIRRIRVETMGRRG